MTDDKRPAMTTDPTPSRMTDPTPAPASPEGAEIRRTDKYNIEIEGLVIRATDEQESRIRQLDPEELARFRRIMGDQR